LGTVPTRSGTQSKPPCARISWFKKNELDLTAMYPAKEEKNALQDGWTWSAFRTPNWRPKDDMTFSLGMAAA
jgi:hypothetical protein